MDNLYELIFNSFGCWHWFGIAISLMIIDLIIGAHFFLIWIGGSAALVGVAVFIMPSLSWQVQFIIFALFSVTSLWIWWFKVKSVHKKTDKPFLNQRASQYIGRTFTLDEPIVNGRGRIRVDDSMWRIDGEDLPVGAKIIVKSADGVVLKVVAKVE